MSKKKVIWECVSCGFTQLKWTGSCSQCQEWNSFVEQVVEEVGKSRFISQETDQKPICLSAVRYTEFDRFQTKLKELDRLFGGGIVEGSLILVGGYPGVGKSTLLLQIAHQYTLQQKRVLYVCGEEAVGQTSLRAKRLKIESDDLYLFHETRFEAIQSQVKILKPHVLIIDSIQILYKSEIPSAPGSVIQVREVTAECMHLAKGLGLTIFLIGHVTKSGDLAGPRLLEHLVDVVLELEGEKKEGFRLLRSMKNRFGPTDDIALFQMKENGMEEVLEPSVLFLEERKKDLPGSVIMPTVEGKRALLIEVQALVTSTNFPSPSRRSIGFDPNRLALLLAVLEKRVGFQLHHCDVFVSVAGGLKIVEPAIDLSVVTALASSFSNRIIDSHTIVFGEVGLGGEIRSVTHLDQRLKEIMHMGFERCVMPRRQIKNVSNNIKEKITLIGVDLVDEVIQTLL